MSKKESNPDPPDVNKKPKAPPVPFFYIEPCCCIHPPGGFCAGGEKANLRLKVMKHLKDKKQEYTGDNAILALFDMDYIDYNKIWKK